jgi:hypothetical protein
LEGKRDDGKSKGDPNRKGKYSDRQFFLETFYLASDDIKNIQNVLL